jgi:hypothetical protein
MIKSVRMAAVVLAVFALFACDQSDKPSAPSITGEGTGSARIKLPSIPAGYVPDSSLDSSGLAVFQLTITGPGMEPIRESWYLTPGQTDPVVVGEIPVGWPRTFTGRLIWMAGWSDSTITHEGMDTVAISRDTVAEVSLYLRKGGSRGAAEVCVQVEGWPADSNCIKRPTLPITDVAGCWRVTVRGPHGTPDSVLRIGELKITQWDSLLAGTIKWASGQMEHAMGAYYPVSTGLVLFGHGGAGGGSYYIKAYFDSNGVALLGEYHDSARTFMGSLRATRLVCDTADTPPVDTLCCMPPRPDTLPPPVIDTLIQQPARTLACWNVRQTLKDGEEMSGSFWLIRRGFATMGSFSWDGFPGMVLSSEHVQSGPDEIYLFGRLSAGLARDSADRVHYKARISGPGSDSLQYGTIYARPAYPDSTWDGFTTRDAFGTWGGTSIPCPEAARNWFMASSYP